MKTMKTVTLAKGDEPMIISKHDKIATGHQSRAVGCGAHADKRHRRCRTRGSQNRRAIEE